MKKISITACIVLIGIVMSCGDNPLHVCATCKELNSNYQPADYCGNKVSVDAYVKTLKSTSGQNWQCTTH
jgi:hypothetical protein